MMTKSTFLKFLLQHQVPLRRAQRAVEIIDGKTRAHVPLSSSETDLIGMGERHVGRYYIVPVRHHAAPHDHRGIRDGIPRPRRATGGTGLAEDGSITADRPAAAATHNDTPPSPPADMTFIQERARRVVDEEEHFARRRC